MRLSMDPATLSAIMSALGPILQAFTGSQGKMGSTYNRGQRSLIDDLVGQVKGRGDQADITQNPQFQQGQDWLMSLFNDPEFFNKFEAPLRRDFEENIGPSIANRYAGMGSGGSTGSTGFRNQLAREAGNLSTNLSAQRGQMQQNAVPQLLGYGQQPFTNYMSMLQNALTPVNNTYQPGLLG